MYNFKGEPIWEIEKADADFYRSIFDIFADKIDTEIQKRNQLSYVIFTQTHFITECMMKQNNNLTMITHLLNE